MVREGFPELTRGDSEARASRGEKRGKRTACANAQRWEQASYMQGTEKLGRMGWGTGALGR